MLGHFLPDFVSQPFQAILSILEIGSRHHSRIRRHVAHMVYQLVEELAQGDVTSALVLLRLAGGHADCASMVSRSTSRHSSAEARKASAMPKRST